VGGSWRFQTTPEEVLLGSIPALQVTSLPAAAELVRYSASDELAVVPFVDDVS